MQSQLVQDELLFSDRLRIELHAHLFSLEETLHLKIIQAKTEGKNIIYVGSRDILVQRSLKNGHEEFLFDLLDMIGNKGNKDRDDDNDPDQQAVEQFDFHG